MRFALLDASVGETVSQTNIESISAEQCFKREFPGHLDTFDVVQEKYPKNVEETYKGVIITGSAASVNDSQEWVSETTEYIQSIHGNVPILGVCWGCQAIAHALGGTVERMDERDIGYREISVIEESRILPNVDSFTAFESHEDVVSELPEMGVVLARSGKTLQAFKVGSSFGVQFHPEYRQEKAKQLIEKYISEPEAVKEQELTSQNREAARVSAIVLDNFYRWCKANAAGCDSVDGADTL